MTISRLFLCQKEGTPIFNASGFNKSKFNDLGTIKGKFTSRTNTSSAVADTTIVEAVIVKGKFISSTKTETKFYSDMTRTGRFKSNNKIESSLSDKMYFFVDINSENSTTSRLSHNANLGSVFHSLTKTGELENMWRQGVATQLAGMYVGVAAYEAKEARSEIPGQILVPGTFASHNRTTSSVGGETRHYKNEPRRKRPGEIIYIFDRNETLVLTLNNLPYNANQTSMRGAIPYKDGKFTEKLNDDVTLEFSALATVPEVARIENEGRAVTRDMDGNFVEFIIREIEDDYSSNSFKTVTAEGGEFELIDEFLPGYTEATVDFKTALKSVIEGTRYEIGEIGDFYGEQSVDLKNMTVRKAVHDLIDQWGGEVRYRVEVKNNRITHRYIDVFEERGSNTGKRFVAGKDIKSVNRTFDSTDVKTALYGRGESDEDGERLTFGDIEWKKSDGDPVDKPSGQTWVGDMDAMEKWGYMGGRRHKFGFYDGQEKDPAALLLKTWEELQKQKELQDTYEVEVVQLGEILDYPHEKVRLGDKVRVINHDMFPELESQAQVIEYEQNLNDPRQSKVTLGHFRAKLDTDRRASDVQKEWNDKKGELEKKPDKVKNELKHDIDKEIEETEKRIEEAKKELKDAMNDIEIGKEDIKGLDKDLESLDKSIEDKVPIGHAAEDINKNNTKIIGKNVVIDGDSTVTGNIGASGATFKEVGTEDMYAKNAIIDQAIIIGEFKGSSATIKEAKLENVVITGKLEGVDGTFNGTIIAENIKGSEIEGVVFDTGTKNDSRIHMEEQELIFYQGASNPSGQQDKLHIGFRNEEGSDVQKPYMIWGYGASNGKDKMIMEKGSQYFYMDYLTEKGTSRMKFNYSGSVGVESKGTLHLSGDDGIVASSNITVAGNLVASKVKSGGDDVVVNNGSDNISLALYQDGSAKQLVVRKNGAVFGQIDFN